MTLPKKLVIGGGIVVFLLVLGAVVVRLAVHPEVFKPQIEQAVLRSTGLTLHMEGPIRLSYFPWIGIEMGRASLGGIKGFEQDPFLRVEGASIKVRLTALLRGNLEAGALRLERPELTLITAPDGRTNWQALPIREVRLEKDQVIVRSDTGQTAFNYLLESFSLTGGSLTFEDRAADRTVRLTDLAVKTGRITSGKTSDVSLAFKLATDKPHVAVTTALTGKLTVDPGDLVFTFDKADLDLTATAADLPFRRLTGSGQADVTVRGQDARVAVRGLNLAATASGGMFPEKGETVHLAGNFTADATAGKLTFSDMRLSGLGLTATGRLDGDLGKPGTEPRFVWQFSTNAFSPKALLASLGITLSGLPEGALSSLETTGEAVFSPSALGLTVKSLRLDGQNLAFSAKVTDFRQPAMTFELTADAVNVDKYLPAAQARPKEAVPGDAKIVASKSVLATSTARVQGHIKVDRLTARGLALTDLDIAVAAADGLVTVSPVSFGLSGGSVHGGMTVALARPVPAWTLNAAVSGVEVKPVLTALTGKAALSGAFSAKAAVATTGTTGKELLSGLAGPVSLRLDHGQVEGFSVSPQLLASIKGLVGLIKLDPQGLVQAVSGFGQAVAASHQGSTPIAVASASFQHKNGVGTTRDILVRVPQGQVTGGGSVDLGRERLNLALTADVTGVGTVPLVVEGPFASPQVTVDKEALAKQTIRAVPKMLEKSGKSVLDSVKGFFQ